MISGHPPPVDGTLIPVAHLRALLEETFPTQEIVYAFAYGSGVLAQQQQHHHQQQQHQQQQPPPSSSSQDAKSPDRLIDLIIVVKDAYRFHQTNLQWNPQHYATPFRWLPRDTAAAYVTAWQRQEWDGTTTDPPPPSYFHENNLEAPTTTTTTTKMITTQRQWLRNPGVYFNVTDRFKYGVIQENDLAHDLKYWSHLYVAGRMQKPIVTLWDAKQSTVEGEEEESVALWQTKYNLPAALAVSLLFLWSATQSSSTHEPSFTIQDAALFEQIAALSYTGDPRMRMGSGRSP